MSDLETMRYDGIMWGPSVRGYLAENKSRIARAEKSLASLKNQTGEYARDHRLLIAMYQEIETILKKHSDMADKAYA